MTVPPSMLTRRSLLRAGALATGALALGPAFWRTSLTSAATPSESPYGPLRPPDANGIRLPDGFRSRVIARANQLVPGTSYRFPVRPDGSATFATSDGGWILAVNAESVAPDAGVSALRFDPAGGVTNAYRILGGTHINCAGGPTPWGTWLSCEEWDLGAVWECDPSQPSQGVRRPALGLFKHEAACVDPAGQRLYLSEDHSDGGFYRFTPDLYPLLGRGLLEIAVVEGRRVRWVPVPEPTPLPGQTPTRHQVPSSTRFRRGEGMWYDSGIVYLATTSDSRLYAYDTVKATIEVIYEKAALENPPLTDADNITVSPSGDLYVCEDPGGEDGIDICLLTPDRTISRFLALVGRQHAGSEACGVVFAPSGRRMYFGSQRATAPGQPPQISDASGAVYEVTGPFRLDRPATGDVAPGAPRRDVRRSPGQSVGSGQAAGGATLVGSALGIEVPRRISWAAARRQGIPVALTLDAPAAVDVRVRGRLRPVRRRGRRRRLARRRSHTLATVRRRRAPRGFQVVLVRLPTAAARLVGGRRQPLRLVLDMTLTDARGRSSRVQRTLLLGAPVPARRGG
jgi:uncharacterized protein